jgi:hypothetical protein
MSDEINFEIKEIAARLSDSQGPDVLKAACLLSTVMALFKVHGLTGTTSGDSLIALQRETLVCWLDAKGLGADNLDRATAAVQRSARRRVS